MLEPIGYFLMVVAAGFLFPATALPIASMIEEKRGMRVAAIGWLTLTLATIAACLVFAAAAPRLGTPTPAQFAFVGQSIMLTALLFAAVFLKGPTAIASSFAKLAKPVVRSAGKTVMWLLILMALVQFSVVVLRYVFGINLIWMQESITYMHGAVFLLAAGYALITNDHVRVDIFYREAPEKRKALTDFLGAYFLLMPTCFVLLWAAGPYVANAWAVGEGSTESSGIQGIFLLKTLIPLFAVLLLLAAFTKAVEASATLRGYR